MEPPGEGDRGAQDGAPREGLHVGSGMTINNTGSGFSRAGSIFTTFDTTQQFRGATGDANARPSDRTQDGRAAGTINPPEEGDSAQLEQRPGLRSVAEALRARLANAAQDEEGDEEGRRQQASQDLATPSNRLSQTAGGGSEEERVSTDGGAQLLDGADSASGTAAQESAAAFMTVVADGAEESGARSAPAAAQKTAFRTPSGLFTAINRLHRDHPPRRHRERRHRRRMSGSCTLVRRLLRRWGEKCKLSRRSR
jgi:hypothetical protein